MILTKYVEIGINYKNIDHFRELGYNVKCSDKIKIKVEELKAQSNIKVKVRCDVCGKEKEIKYQSYQKNTDFGKKEYACCEKCAWKHKNRNTNIIKYGVEVSILNKEIKQKSKDTLIEKYGVDNISKSDYFKETYKNTIKNKYGVDNVFQNEDIKNKSKETMLNKYGVEYNMQREEMKDIYLNGESNYFYIDGRHELNKGEWKSNKDADKVRVKVFKRDNRTCQCCGTYNDNINAHHLHSRNTRKDLIYDENNIVTLCSKCHKLFHSIYGYGNNTPEQYYEFLEKYKV